MKIEVEYQCQHLTCKMPVCQAGTLILEQAKFDMLLHNCTEPGCFTSPSNACKIGHNQIFKIMERKPVDENAVAVPEKQEVSAIKKQEIVQQSEVGKVILKDELSQIMAENFYELKMKVELLEKRIMKIENAKKGSKVSRKEE